jgi:hypothetical protein
MTGNAKIAAAWLRQQLSDCPRSKGEYIPFFLMPLKFFHGVQLLDCDSLCKCLVLMFCGDLCCSY